MRCAAVLFLIPLRLVVSFAMAELAQVWSKDTVYICVAFPYQSCATCIATLTASTVVLLPFRAFGHEGHTLRRDKVHFRQLEASYTTLHRESLLAELPAGCTRR